MGKEQVKAKLKEQEQEPVADSVQEKRERESNPYEVLYNYLLIFSYILLALYIGSTIARYAVIYAVMKKAEEYDG